MSSNVCPASPYEISLRTSFRSMSNSLMFFVTLPVSKSVAARSAFFLWSFFPRNAESHCRRDDSILERIEAFTDTLRWFSRHPRRCASFIELSSSYFQLLSRFGDTFVLRVGHTVNFLGIYVTAIASSLDRYLEELGWRFNNRNNPNIFQDTIKRIVPER